MQNLLSETCIKNVSRKRFVGKKCHHLISDTQHIARDAILLRIITCNNRSTILWKLDQKLNFLDYIIPSLEILFGDELSVSYWWFDLTYSIENMAISYILILSFLPLISSKFFYSRKFNTALMYQIWEFPNN